MISMIVDVDEETEPASSLTNSDEEGDKQEKEVDLKKHKKKQNKQSEKKGTVLTHTVNKISQTKDAPSIQHATSKIKTTSRLKQQSRNTTT